VVEEEEEVVVVVVVVCKQTDAVWKWNETGRVGSV
jgi:hypothetical protein